ncbi:hypothetical protein P22_3005 [Propionispora sp. 2/2-37]|uniref:peptidase U32 family protein n=1 Tax=Propionispora sp. 2/2-37 TaxID=1677858 RepID=UPI0006BB7E27|nr:U32 family peptidase [Propionispora sp. 2/2-37]CUH96893.1 hypothetical protein P22_3005 [Propionispora sp. 2/2-37]
MIPNYVELLAPAGTWDVLEAAVAAGADAVYLGGKRFNMRLHRTDANFDDEMLKKAVQYAHDHNVRLYITVNNLINDNELIGMRSYLQFLNEIQPDALIVQDLAILELARELRLTLPLHASVMMNTHNEHAVRLLQKYGISRVVANREMALTQLTLLKERTGIEIEYFVHGDMCVAHSGQCTHSGIVFGQSSNRGRCLKPCRWPYQFIGAGQDAPIAHNEPGPYKLALKDMCMYRNLPDLIQSGVCSFKIEGRMRTADFITKIVSIYRRAIDRYINDPTGYFIDEQDWQELYNSRVRDFSTCYAFGNPGSSAVGYTGKREPRFFSQAVKEAGIPENLQIANSYQQNTALPKLSVRVADLPSLHEVCQAGADVIYIGGEAFYPAKPWTLQEIKEGLSIARRYNAKIVVTTPRVTTERECQELIQLFTSLNELRPDGIMTSNPGSLSLAGSLTQLPLYTDASFNPFNHITLQFLKKQGVCQAAISTEATYTEVSKLAASHSLDCELIVHGSLEAMITDHDLSLSLPEAQRINFWKQEYSLLDSAGERHLICKDQYNRSHILFGKDLCLLPYLSGLAHLASWRLEGQHYSPEQIGFITRIYRQELIRLKEQKENYIFNSAILKELISHSPRELGIGAFRYRQSR